MTGRNGGIGRLGARLAGIAIGVALLAGWLAAVPPATRAADPPALNYSGTTTYLVEPEQRLVHVTISITATPKLPAGSKLGYEGLDVAVPSSTAHFEASTDGHPLGVTVRRPTSADALVHVAFGRTLRPPETITFWLEFDIVDLLEAPDRDLRISPTLVSFPLWAFGTVGTPGSSLSVVLPAGYDVSLEAGDLQRGTDYLGRIVLSSGPIADPSRFLAWLTAQHWPEYSERTLQAGNLTVTLRFWSDDPGWALAVAKLVEDGYPALRELIGAGDPAATQLVVEESTSRDTKGYGGIFDPSTDRVRVSYLADPFLVLHEMAHLWFNRTEIGDRWIEEAFASYYAQAAGDVLGLQLRVPRLTPALSVAAIPLDSWVELGDSASLQEEYAYAATLEVATEIAGAGPQVPSALRSIWRGLAEGRATYQPIHHAPTETRAARPLGWRELLDYLELQTGLSFDRLWRTWIVTDGEIAELDARDAARTTCARVAAEAATWELPPEIRHALATWNFSAATTDLHRADLLLAERTAIADAAAAQKTTVPDRLQEAFETSLDAAASEADDEQQTLALIAAAAHAQSASPDTMRKVGLVGADPVTDLAAAREAFAAGDLARATELAASARDVWEGAGNSGRERLVVVTGVAAGVLVALLLALVYRRTRSARPAAARAARAVDLHAPLASLRPAGDDAASPRPRSEGGSRQL